MDLDLELRRNLREINAHLDLLATLAPADALKLAEKKPPGAKELLAKLQSWTAPGHLEDNQLRLSELLACVADVAVRQSDFATADACVSWYFYLAYPRDQFYCRVLFVRAKCLAENAKAMQGQACVAQLQYAIHWILQAVKLALEPTSRPHYDFLVYNASVTYWHVARPLMRPGSARHLVESMQAILDGLKAVNDADKAWMIRFELTLASAYEDENQLSKAGKVINEAVDHVLALLPKTPEAAATAPADAALFEEASIMQVHLGRHKDPECAKALATAKKNMVTKRQLTLFNLQSIKSKITPPETIRAALLEIFATTTGHKLEMFQQPIPPIVPDDGTVEWDSLVELGLLAVQHHHVDIAKICEHVASASKRLSARVRIMTDLLRCFLQMEPPAAAAPTAAATAHDAYKSATPSTGHRAGSPTHATTSAAAAPVDAKLLHLDKRQREAHRLSRHVEGVKVLERSLAAAKRVGDPNLIQDICILAWNVAMPLLESHLRKHVHRLFQSATALLEDLESPLVALRAQMHFETAKCEMESDYLAKASTHVNKALALDYGGPKPAESKGTDAHTTKPNGGAIAAKPSAGIVDDVSVRPLDKLLVPMKRTLDLKSNLYGEPDAIEDQALIIVEQSREAHDNHLKATLLSKAAALLETAPPEPNTPAAAASPIALQRYALWSAMAKLAWQIKNIPMTRKASSKALKYSFPLDFAQSIEQGTPFCHIMALTHECMWLGELHFVLAETYSHEIKGYEKDPNVAAVQLRLGTAVDEILDEPFATIHACKKHVIAEIVLGLQRGLDAKVPYVVQNAATYLWNYHFHLFRKPYDQLDRVLPELSAALDQVFQALLTAENLTDQLPLLSCVAQSLTVLHRGQPNEMEAPLDAVLKRDGLPILHRKALIEIKTQVQLDRAAKDPVVGDTTAMKVVSCIKGLEVQLDALTGRDVPKDEEKALLDKALGFYQKATTLWLPHAAEAFAAVESLLELEQQKREFHAEMWVRLAKAALLLHRTPDAQKFCEQAVLPLQASNIPPPFLTKSIWRWYSLAQLVWAQAVLQLAADTEAQERDIKQELALFAIKHLLLGAEFGVHAGNPSLVQNASRLMWNGMLPILDLNGSPTPSFRRKLTADMHIMLDHLSAVDAGQYAFRADFVCALLDIYEEVQEWGAGLSTVEAAFAVIPPAHQRPLWRYRVIFMSKLGKSVQDGFAKMKENDVLLQARVSKRIAASSTDPGAQYKALYRAVKDLQGRTEQAQFLVEIAEWFYTNEFPLDDVHDQLHGVIHMLLPVLQRDMAGGDDKAASGKKTAAKKKRKDDTTTPPLEWWHLDLLLRAHVMLALAARTFRERLDYTFAALGHVLKIWDALQQEHVLVQFKEAFEVYVAAPQDAAEPKLDFDDWKATRPPGFVTPAFHVPTSTHGWAHATFDSVVPTLCGQTPLSKASPVLLHPASVTQPTLTLYYLNKLMTLAIEMYQHPHVVPCLWLAKLLVVATSAMSTSSMAGLSELPLMPVLLDLKLAHVLGALTYTEMSQVCLKRAIDALRAANEPPSSTIVSHLPSDKGNLATSTRRHRPLVSSKYNVLALCTEIADQLLDAGYHLQVKLLLELTAHQCTTAGDSHTLAYVDYCRGKLCLLEGQVVAALQHLQLACGTDGLDVHTFTKSVILYTSTLRRHGHAKPAKAALQHALGVLDRLQQLKLTPTPVQLKLLDNHVPTDDDLDAVDCTARLHAAYAELLVHESQTLQATGGDWGNAWAEAMRVFAACVDTWARLGGSFAMVDVASAWGALLVAKASDELADVDPRAMFDQARAALEVAHGFLEGVWDATDVAVDRDVDVINPALGSRLAQLKLELARVELATAHAGDETKMVVYRIESDAKKNLIELWLERTAPKHEKTVEEMQVPPIEMALLYANGAAALTQLAPEPRVAATVAQCLRRQLQPDDTQWSYSSEALRKQGIASAVGPSPAPVAPPTGKAAAVAAATVIDVPPPTAQDERVQDCMRLLQATLEMAIACRDRATIQQCTFELMQAYGCRDVALAIKYLLWFQSCRTSVVAQELLVEACEPTNRTALFMHRVQHLPSTSVPAQLAHLFLDHESEVWRRLGVTAHIDQVLAALPPNYTVFSLQFSVDAKYLYAAVVGGGSAPPFLARMEFHRPRRTALRELVAKIKAWRLSTVKTLLQYSDAMMGEHDAFEFAASDKATQPDDILETQFEALVEETRGLFAPLLECVQAALTSKPSSGDDAFVVFLADPALESLPFEVLIDGIDARDLSMHILASRLQSYKSMPYKRDDLYYVADPQNDEPSDDGHSIQATLNNLKSVVHGVKGLSGRKYVPSTGEWQMALTSRRGGGFLFYGPNRSLAHFPPSFVAGLNAGKCNLVVSMSRMENYASYRRQSKLDTHKSKRVLSLEDGWESAALWSLCGVNCVVTNQWNTSFVANHRVVQGLFGQLAKNVPVAKAIKHIGDVWLAAPVQHEKKADAPLHGTLKRRVRYNPIVYGVAHLV
ncbi:Aste57867_10079 [Aphanomyces stellatus]|uniref:Aste57867_10079 protein n=1 Tax=Aphanomyces stellatus TaxID=120398 RepID=A0A485KQ62_9STRA|nr:hypothetical protein As57867_010040 [Aphanomyces stellatus]VFT86955.1 Aste57867_10079 [Aphanomyces stellatus]